MNATLYLPKINGRDIGMSMIGGKKVWHVLFELAITSFIKKNANA